MSLQKQQSSEENSKSLEHILNVLVNAIQNTTAGSAKFLVYLVCTVAILNIIGHEQISSLNIQPAILYIIKGVIASPIIQRLVEKLGGDLLASKIEQFIKHDSPNDDQILAFVENQINNNKLNDLLQTIIQDSSLLKEKDFFRVASRQLREGQKQTAMLEYLVEHAIAAPIADVSQNTPYQLPSRMLTENFVNREDEMKLLLAHLHPGKTVIITGSGGVGKSALSAKALWQIHDDFELMSRFPDGVVIYDCSLQSDMRLASSTIAQIFGFPPVNDPNIIKNILNSKRALFVFDNAEESTGLEILLSGEHSCGILITSRKYLEIDAMYIELQRLSEAHGEELLQKLLNFETTTESTLARELIRELEGLPLALTLASKRIKRRQHSTTSYLQSLNSSLHTLEIANNREQSLPLVIQQSINAVSKAARLILFVLGNHAYRPLTNVTFAIAFHPNFQYSNDEIQEALSELIDHNLIQVHKVTVNDGMFIPMYGLKHRLIHRYIQEYSSQEWNEEWNKILDRMVSNVVLGPLELFIREPEVSEEVYSDGLYIDALILQENLLREKRWDEAIHCSEVLYRHAKYNSDSTEKSQILRAGLKVAIELDDKFGQTNILSELGDLSLWEGDLDNSEKHLIRALELSKLDQNVENEASILNRLAILFHNKGNNEEAFSYHQRAYSLSSSIKNNGVKFQILTDFGLSIIKYRYGHPKQAISLVESALPIARKEEENYSHSLASIYFYLSFAYVAAGDQNGAINSLKEASNFAEQHRQQDLNLSAKTKLGNIYHSLGQFEDAKTCFQETLPLARETNDKQTYAVNSGNLGLVYQQLNNKEEATICFKEALEFFEETHQEYAQLTRERLEKLLTK